MSTLLGKQSILFLASSAIALGLMQSISATPTLVDASDFDHTTIIGKVFVDENVNGYLDYGEVGIPGVRLATVTGLLLESDGYGRFHILDEHHKSKGFSQNQLIKIDMSSLPEGAIMTTENPRLLRTTNMGLNKVNFGVTF